MGNYFGLEKRPFIAEPVPEGFCPFGNAEHARVQVSRCVSRQEGVALVSGFSGTGKTLLCRTLQKQFQDSMPTVLLNGENLTEPQAFFEILLSRLELPFDSRNLATMRDTLSRHLENSPRFRSGLLILVDDAQATAIRVYEEMRQLLDYTETLGQGVRVVLVGDMSLEEKLTFEKLNSFSKRVTVRAFLEKFNRSETEAFLKMELTEAGDTKGIFSQDVCREIYRFAEGVPRLTNQLADYLLIFGLESVQETEETKEEVWDADPLPIDTGDSSIFDDTNQPEKNELTQEKLAEDANKVENEKGLVQNLFQIEFTPTMVQRAWNKMQNFPDENDKNEDQNSTSTIQTSGITSGSVSNITFGALDDADDIDDVAHTIDFSPTVSSPEEATGKWAYEDLYDELQEIRDTVDELNNIPEEWESSTSTNNEETVTESNKTPTTDDLFDPRREVPNFHFPKSEETVPSAWQPPHYTAQRTEGTRNPDISNTVSRSSGNLGNLNSTSENITSEYSSKKLSFSGINSCDTSEFVRKRNMTVDDIIYDAIMDDTVHSMKLLQRILNALREENLQRTQVPQPADYWLNMQGLIKDSMRTIASARMSQTEELRKDEELQNRIRTALVGRNVPCRGTSTVSTSSVERGDFYRPESLLEEGTLRYNSYSNTPGSRFSKGNTMSPLEMNPVSETPSESSGTPAEGFTEVALLRTLLQDENVRNSIDQEKLSQIISQLRTMSQIS